MNAIQTLCVLGGISLFLIFLILWTYWVREVEAIEPFYVVTSALLFCSAFAFFAILFNF